MQSNAVELVSSPRRGSGANRPAARAEAARWQGDETDFLHQSHRVAERAACCLTGVTLCTLAMYNLALWLMR